MASFRQLDSGLWNVQIRKNGKFISKSFILKTDAEKWARQTEVELDRGVFQNKTVAENTSLGDVCVRFEDEIIHKFKSWKSDRARLNNIRSNRISKVLLANLNSADLTKFRDDRLRDGMSETSINHELTLISRVLKTCMIDWGIFLPHGIPQVRKFKKADGRHRRISDDEINALIKATESELLGDIMIIAIETAMRRNEIISLINANVDLKNKIAKLFETKNGSNREVPLSPVAVDILKKRIGKKPNDFIFNIKGQSVTRAFERSVKRAREIYLLDCKLNKKRPVPNFLVDIRFHDLRHEATSRLAKKVPNVIELSSITGHKDVQMLKRYYHVDATELAAKLV